MDSEENNSKEMKKGGDDRQVHMPNAKSTLYMLKTLSGQLKEFEAIFGHPLPFSFLAKRYLDVPNDRKKVNACVLKPIVLHDLFRLYVITSP